MSDRNAYMKNYMRNRRDGIRDREHIRRAVDRERVEYEARKADVDFFPLMAGYRAAERGQPYDRGQPQDWRTGWSLWHRRNGKSGRAA